MKRTQSLAILTLAAALGACSTAGSGIDADLGSSVRHNVAVQTINPDPVYDAPAPVMADRATGAVKRYRADQVEQPRGARTSEVGETPASGSGVSTNPD